jgi:hypothetical protein
LSPLWPSTVAPAADNVWTNSKFGRELLANARALHGKDGNYKFVCNSLIKFQGCHHVSQCKANADDKDDVRIKSKHYGWFHFCPSGSWRNDCSLECTTKFGRDCAVDLSTFVAVYLGDADKDK